MNITLNYKAMNKLKPIILFNIGHFSKYLNKKHNNGKFWKERNVRILTKDELYSTVENNGLNEELSGNDKNNGLNNVTYSLQINEELSKNRSNIINSYRKKLKYGYTKKKGLKKFGCFCEKVVLDEMDKIGNLSEYKNITKKCFKRIVCHNNGIIITFFTFFLLFGIFISLASFNYTKSFVTKLINHTDVLPAGLTVLFILLMLVLLLIIYIKSKVKKYKKLTEGNME
ncbi:hypothetical protein PVBG_05906 [Plasmodium vivax Brazil I]|uniref:Variable surface protein Vir35 n=1 Tax=Plasmodium vivax (strain Brazil I) TaxID=1033975 RepID=A0A0J9SKB6_PLAV1|nr:hypothetical protein PVBG_06110 [Plasmodium vivax Brazil I]KMZ89395.1 hypothetical protein PVBG_05906 [Plasmodium vivax Brazil I]